MKVKFKVEGKVGLNYGMSGIIDVTKGEVVDVLEAHALILIKDNIAVEANEDAPAPVQVEAEEEVEAEVEAEVVMVTQPKKRGRKKKGE